MNMSISDVTMKLNMDRYLLLALEEDITSEDVSANAVMNRPCLGEVELICKQSGVLAGLQVFSRVFELLDERFTMESFCATAIGWNRASVWPCCAAISALCFPVSAQR